MAGHDVTALLVAWADGDQAALDATIAEIDASAQTFVDDEFTPTFEALGNACPELNEVD